jgi:hypothetical protein
MADYPAPPWILKGDAWQALQLVEIDRTRSFIPSSVDILPILPGKTLGGVGVARYQEGSTLLYSELIVVAAIARFGYRFGAWISHIYVDSPESVAGGREIWGLPKELAEFHWQGEQDVTVLQGEMTLCRIKQKPSLSLWRSPLILPNLSLRAQDQQLLYFQASGTATLKAASLSLTIPPPSPFAALNLEKPFLSVGGEDLDLTIAAANSAS